MRQKTWLARFALAFCVLFLSCAALAAVETEKLSSPELDARYRVLIEEMRCPKCQNQNLAGSDATISTDLRREIRHLLEEGFTDQEIIDYMVARYGDFVLYRPPVQGNTLVLWLAPGVFALVGLLALIVVVVRSRSGTGARQDDASGELSDDERRRLKRLLGDESGDAGNGGKKSK
ncbi:cytochrome c-type biogenesis protein CcmH [Microbulbifer sp. OS29]|uniref:Cytochrome c-type biogenesis protein n=1 Tax=Microbulbifer okhotskensis TaxID=2926617 RepID=A0A9X2J623_9GAMM|nr:cytochrome c-type biogenesis protein CcmH [Microbulbifer okhotskensis]MCO1335818.1 cytochrome c-type biogenesis protein CcmH [Microbulbifer okhotskensis]